MNLGQSRGNKGALHRGGGGGGEKVLLFQMSLVQICVDLERSTQPFLTLPQERGLEG